jgi:predicted metalloprotease
VEWEGREESSNVEDQRGMGGMATKVGIGGGVVGVLVLLAGWIFGVDPSKLAELTGNRSAPNSHTASPEEQKLAKFSSVIFRSTEDVWHAQFKRLGKTYVEPKLVLYTDHVRSGCGNADSSVGPFYCGADQHVYLDLSFYDDMQKKLGAPGEFARAYVIAHEVGHHVQHLLGYSVRAEEMVRRGQQTKNEASVRLELQADYLAGVWAHYAKDVFKVNEKDIQTAINAAYEIGDDRLRKKAGMPVNPEKFTHGSSKQRMHWFMEGYNSGSVEGADQLFTLPYNKL